MAGLPVLPRNTGSTNTPTVASVVILNKLAQGLRGLLLLHSYPNP
jgi:hypothetical protein